MESLGIVSAYILDLVFGDPRWLPHPVKVIGRLITFLEKKLRTGRQKYTLRIKGVILTIVVAAGSAFTAYILLYYAERINYIFKIIMWIFLAYTSLAVKDLFVHVKVILEKIKNKDTQGARQKLSLIVGRDTKDLSEEKIITAAIESISENTNDGIIAPLFYLILGGPVLAISYKAINTLDSMVGYRNKRYIDFGWFSARLDDVANFIPARITGLLIAISSLILGHSFKSSFTTMCRDGKMHASPNSGLPEAAMAGALGVRLGGPCAYQGKFSDKPYFGEDKTPIRPSLINEALRISFITSFFMVLMGVLLKCVL
jgi:adenosylcobinamide-phosphate synthase